MNQTADDEIRIINRRVVRNPNPPRSQPSCSRIQNSVPTPASRSLDEPVYEFTTDEDCRRSISISTHASTASISAR